jgi:hypothetical protein
LVKAGATQKQACEMYGATSTPALNCTQFSI